MNKQYFIECECLECEITKKFEHKKGSMQRFVCPNCRDIMFPIRSYLVDSNNKVTPIYDVKDDE